MTTRFLRKYLEGGPVIAAALAAGKDAPAWRNLKPEEAVIQDCTYISHYLIGD
jgi:hypothetical protein